MNHPEEDRHSKDILHRKRVSCLDCKDGKKARFSYSNEERLAQAVDD